MKSISIWKISLVTILLLGVTVVCGADAFAQTGLAQQGVNDISDKTATPLMTTVGTLVNVFLFLIGAVAVIMIIYGGFRYITSAGDSGAVSSAKNTILYAAVGLIIAASAYAIVGFVLNESNPPQSWADCMQIEDLSKRKQCQVDMIEAGAPDVPTEAVKGGVIDQ